jgi:hypothetical protein
MDGKQKGAPTSLQCAYHIGNQKSVITIVIVNSQPKMLSKIGCSTSTVYTWIS